MRRRRRVDHHSDRPVYKQVADDMREQIISGILKPGEALPGEARIADEYEVGTNTIRSALALLRAEGLIVTEKAVGSRVRERGERAIVDLPPGAKIDVRPPTDEDRRDLSKLGKVLGDGEPVAEIQEADGTTQVHPAYQTTFVTPPDGE